MAVAEAVTQRVRRANEALAKTPPSFCIRAADIGLLVVIALALAQAFTHFRGRKWFRRGFQIAVIVYLGFLNGDLLAQSLFAGWAANGIPWRIAPGLVLLAAVRQT